LDAGHELSLAMAKGGVDKRRRELGGDEDGDYEGLKVGVFGGESEGERTRKPQLWLL
jgi:hypothetical protein